MANAYTALQTNLCQGLAVGLDVVCAPQYQGNSLRVVALVVQALTLQQALNHHARTLQGSLWVGARAWRCMQ